MMQVDTVSFEYPGLRALDRVSLHVRAGRITALVGPNGAGKSTLLRILAVLQPPLSGQVTMDGMDVFAQPRQAHRHIGFLPDFFGLYDSLTVQQCLTYFALAHHVERSAVAAAVLQAAQLLKLEDRLDQPAAKLSRGLRQRLAIAQAIVHRPRLLLLDEPASGLDPEARHTLAETFLQLRNDGVTLLVSSHILSELEAYCDDMIILRQGRIVGHQHGDEAAEKVTLRMQLLPCSEAEQQMYRGKISAINGVQNLRQDKDLALLFQFDDAPQARQQLLRELVLRDIPLISFDDHRFSLQDAYMATGDST
ncbi:MAG: ABC transporter ATP-binding protein [Mariprofundaceae bacterium]|nr:ABC transporter ATP-binding protein [Mariprofundaceae bacterium]